MTDCAQQLIDCGICDQEEAALYAEWNTKSIECMSRWMVYFSECWIAAAAGEAEPKAPGDAESRCAKQAKAAVESLRKRGYEINPVDEK